MIRKYLVLAALALVAITPLRAQDEPEQEEKRGFDKSKLFFGGNFGLSFGSSFTLINVSPQVGYRFNRYVAAGTGVNFIYSSSKYDWYGFRDNFGVAGLNIFGRVYPIEQLFAQVQPELNYTWGKRKYNGGQEQKLDGSFVPSLLIGAGGAIPMGGRGAMIVMIQYDVLQRDRAPYGKNAFVSVGFNF